MSLSFVACYRDREVERLRHSLDSLKRQTCLDFDMVLVDYGSRSSCSAAIRELLGNYSFCRYCYSDSRGWMWNRSAALNTGARLSQHPVLFLTDVDIIYPPWFVERLMQHRSDKVFFASACFRCPKQFDNWQQLGGNEFRHNWSEMKGKGLMCSPRRALEEVGGLDETFAYWGQEDHDFAERLARSGLKELELAEIHCYHQWHPHVIYDLPLTVQFNNLAQYYAGHTESRVRANERREWGKLARSEGRPIFAYVDPETGVPRSGVPIKTAEAFGVANVLTTLRTIATSKNVMWALPTYDFSDKNASFLNKVLRRVGWRLDRRLGYAADVAQGLLVAAPGLFRDYYLNGSMGGRNCAFFLT